MRDLCREPQCSGTLRMLKIFSCAPSQVMSSDEEASKDHERVDFNIHRPTYTVTYLGCDTLYKPGLTEMCDAVRMMLYEHKAKLKSKAGFTLCLSKQELTLREQEGTEAEERVFGLRRILFCGVYRPKQNIFFFNYQFGSKGEQVDCHVVVCKNKREARSLAEVIRKAFRETQHDAHIEDQANKRQHLQGLSKSLNSLDSQPEGSSGVSTVQANRHFYVNLNFARENAGYSDRRAANRARTPPATIRSGVCSMSSDKDSNYKEQKADQRNLSSTEALITNQTHRRQETGSRSRSCADLEESTQDNGRDTRL